jgi:tRNA threonylcarbamoyladenosine biosynthesis protein TsaE
MEQKEYIYGPQEIPRMVDFLMTLAADYPVFTFTGPLGAGKTTLVQGLLRRFGVDGVITSPTFTYVNIYRTPQEQTFYHFDCYRIPTVDAFLEAGFGEYIYQPNSWALIEWPEVIDPLLPKACHVAIDYYGDDMRVLVCKGVDKEV